jgi:hypothetical protein
LGDDYLLVELARSQPEYIEDARDWLDERLGRERVIQTVAAGLCPYGVRLFHGTRLTDGELEQVRQHGLKPLNLADRADRIAEILRLHTRWAEVEARLPQAIVRFGPQARAGRREDGCVHACFSRSGLLLGCSHYLTYGAEVDGHIAHQLFGDASAGALFRRERKPYLISFVVPFDDAARGSHSFGELVAGQEIIVDKLVGAWAYWQAHSEFQITTQRSGWAAKFPGAIEPDRLTIEPVDDSGLEED